MIAFAMKTLVADRSKLLSGLAGVIFSVVLVNVQGGLYFGLMRKASLLVDNGRADLWVGYRMVENVDLSREIPEFWSNRLRGLPGVDCVKPLIVGKGTATLPDGHMEDVWIVGADPSSTVGSGWGFVVGSQRALRRPDSVSFDDIDSHKLGEPKVGDWLEVNGHRTQLVAQTHGVSGFMTMPIMFTTFETARRMSNIAAGACSYLLIRVQPGRDVEQVRSAVRRRLPDATVLTPHEFAKISKDYWMKRTGIGLSFGASTGLGLLVGLLIVAQTLYALALDHTEDYATLKALGAEESDICRVIVAQACLMGGTGSVLAMGLVAVIGKCWYSTLAPIEIPLKLSAASVAVVFAICLLASLLPYVRIRKIDPAMVLLG